MFLLARIEWLFRVCICFITLANNTMDFSKGITFLKWLTKKPVKTKKFKAEDKKGHISQVSSAAV